MFSSQRLQNAGRDERAAEPKRHPDSKLVVPARNLLIASLPHPDCSELIQAARPVHFSVGDVIYEDGSEIDYAYFPIDAVISSLALLEDGSSVEVSMTGRESLVGLPALIGGGRALHWTRISVAGVTLRIPTTDLRRLFNSNQSLHSAILRAYRGLFTQICQRSVCNSRHTLLQRLCVYLLMMNDRLDSDEIPMTQDEIACRISVRRAGVSTAGSMLHAMHAIDSRRGKIVIVDRAVLENTACECYRVLRQEFETREDPRSQSKA